MTRNILSYVLRIVRRLYLCLHASRHLVYDVAWEMRAAWPS